MPVPIVRRCPVHGFRYYVDPPRFTLRRLPEGAQIILADGGFWIVDALTGIRYRRVTMEDLPRKACWNTRGKASDYEQ